MLGIDLYKEVLLNGEKYKGKEYKDKNGETYHIGIIFDDYSIFRNSDNASMLNCENLKHGCKDIHNFMKSELEEVKQEIEMKWYECIEKYADEPNKYYIKVEDVTANSIYTYCCNKLVDDKDNALSLYEIKYCNWYLCER